MKRNYRPKIDYNKVREMEEMKEKHPHKNCVFENIYSFHKKNYSIGDNKVFKADVLPLFRKLQPTGRPKAKSTSRCLKCKISCMAYQVSQLKMMSQSPVL
jgi:hypothetical protein